MNIDISSIKNPQVKTFYALRWSQHLIVVEFYQRLEETQYDFRLVDTPERKSDTPRQSLAHLLYVELVYFNGVKTGKLEFKDMGVEHYKSKTKDQLLTEVERIDQVVFAHLTSDTFDSLLLVEVPWGGRMNVMDMLFFLRDHDILHIGWNLALMDALKIPRYPALIQYWG
jgi:uncharacterized damage-inducible protein DinB